MSNTTEIANRKQADQQRAVIRATLTGSDCCSALGITARSPSPVLLLCRRSLEAGHDPITPLEAYRGDALALRIRSLGEGARLEVNAHGTGFIAHCERQASPPHRARRKAA